MAVAQTPAIQESLPELHKFAGTYCLPGISKEVEVVPGIMDFKEHLQDVQATCHPIMLRPKHGNSNYKLTAGVECLPHLCKHLVDIE